MAGSGRTILARRRTTWSFGIDMAGASAVGKAEGGKRDVCRKPEDVEGTYVRTVGEDDPQKRSDDAKTEVVKQ